MVAKWKVRHGKEAHELIAGRVRISLHRHIHYPPDTWLVSCGEAEFSAFELVSKTVDDAKKEAVDLVKDRLRTMLAGLD